MSLTGSQTSDFILVAIDAAFAYGMIGRGDHWVGRWARRAILVELSTGPRRFNARAITVWRV